MTDELRELMKQFFAQENIEGMPALKAMIRMEQIISPDPKSITIDDEAWLAIAPKHRVNLIGLYCSRGLSIYGRE